MASAVHSRNTTLYLTAYFLLLIAPSVMVTHIYTLFGRIFRATCPVTSTPPINKSFWSFLTSVLTLWNITAALVQIISAARYAQSMAIIGDWESSWNDLQDAIKSALYYHAVYMMGIGLQVSCYIAFVIILWRFMKISQEWTARVDESDMGTDVRGWKKLFWPMFGSGLLLSVSAHHA
jgi:hypothetical protein